MSGIGRHLTDMTSHADDVRSSGYGGHRGCVRGKQLDQIILAADGGFHDGVLSPGWYSLVRHDAGYMLVRDRDTGWAMFWRWELTREQIGGGAEITHRRAVSESARGYGVVARQTSQTSLS
jgi:hypothetical protein